MKSTTAAAAVSGVALLLAGHTKGSLIQLEWTVALALPLAAAVVLWVADRRRETVYGPGSPGP